MKKPFKIAFIGAGKMGLPVCRRLKSAGHDVRVFARRPEQASQLQASGFAVSSAAPDLVGSADIIFTCVSDDKALADVVMNEAFRAAVAERALLIDLSTVSPGISAEVARFLPQGVSFLRSPVSGSTVMAEAGTLTVLVSGPKPAFDGCADLFAAFTKKAFHLGEGEEARYLKLAINSMVAATSALLGEALAFGSKGGMSNDAMLEVIMQSVVASPLIGYKKDMIAGGNYAPAATLNMLAKDLDLFLASAAEIGVATPVNTVIRKSYSAAAGNGLGEMDFFVLVQEAEMAARHTA
jgi:3-hydroxyisobutyrate dehydrogenase-like beta-hydroxyacid dehydrogenase